jgi:murein DD-endopeptidase MepM/ murein hydrolase activator NlpD
MRGKKITLVLIPNSSTNKVKEMNISYGMLVSILIIVVTGLLSLATFLITSKNGNQQVVKETTSNNNLNIKNANDPLIKRISELQSEIKRLNGVMGDLVKNDDMLRTVADLPPVSLDTRMVGRGGPSLKYNDVYNNSPDAKTVSNIEFDIDKLVKQAEFQKDSYSKIQDQLTRNSDILAHIPSITPTNGYFTSFFGMRKDPFTGKETFHSGIDISARIGEPVYASADGEVTYDDFSNGFGLTIIIDHKYGYSTLYGHLSKILVHRGDKIKRGDLIGEVGSTGRSTAPHLHYTVRLNGKDIDPADFLYVNETPASFVKN